MKIETGRAENVMTDAYAFGVFFTLEIMGEGFSPTTGLNLYWGRFQYWLKVHWWL